MLSLPINDIYSIGSKSPSRVCSPQLLWTDVVWHRSCCKPNRPLKRLRLGTQSNTVDVTAGMWENHGLDQCCSTPNAAHFLCLPNQTLISSLGPEMGVRKRRLSKSGAGSYRTGLRNTGLDGPPFLHSVVNIPGDRFHFTVPFCTGNREECGLV